MVRKSTLAAMKALTLGVGVAALINMHSAPAMAADLGGDCCADLEERVAELEATTVRKGNRKVSLSISGHVNNAIMFWDDGQETNAYVVDNNHSATRLRFKGKAKISSSWSAGYYIELQIDGLAGSNSVNQSDDNAGAGGPNVRHSMLYIKSETYGKISLGHTSPALDDLTHYGYYHGGWAQADWHLGGGFFLRRSDTGALTGAKISSFATGFDEARRNVVRYDSPKIAGFTVAAAWGEDDYWDVALRYAGTLGDFKVKAAVGYNQDHDEGAAAFGGLETDDDAIKASGIITHTPTGLFLYGAYTEENHDGTTTEQDEEGYMISVGVKKKWFPLGATSIWGSYVHSDGDGTNDASDATDLVAGGALVTSSEVERFDIGASQWVDAAALELYVIYSETEFDIDVDNVAVPLEDFQTVVVGGRIKF